MASDYTAQVPYALTCDDAGAVIYNGQGENVHEYVKKSALAKMLGLHRAGLEVLRAGFYDIVDGELQQLMRNQDVSWCDLQLMVNGIPEVDVEALKASTVYRNGNASLPKVKWFFEVLEGWQRYGKPPRTKTVLLSCIATALSAPCASGTTTDGLAHIHVGATRCAMIRK